MDPLSVVASCIAITQALSKTYEIIRTISGLPAAFEEVNRQLPIVEQTLKNVRLRLRRDPEPSDEEEAIILNIVKHCEEKAKKLNEIFEKIKAKCESAKEPAPWDKVHSIYRKALAGAKANRVESLLKDILADIKLLALNQIFQLTMEKDFSSIEKAIENLGAVEPSLPDSELEESGIINAQQTVESGAQGQQNNVQGGENTFNSGQFVAQTQTIHYGVENSNYKLQLPIARDAAFGSAVDQHESGCLPGTREDVLETILSWIDSPHEKCLFWLNGEAGAGKSTISRTICRRLVEKSLLGGSFFFKRGEGDRGNATRLFTTLAHRLAIYFPEVKSSIKEVLDADGDIPTRAFTEQFTKLILQPLSNAKNISSTVVIVIDALDECEGIQDIKAIISVLALAKDANPVDLRVFVTSRPDSPLLSGFAKVVTQEYRLNEARCITDDIRLYLKTKLDEIRFEAEKRLRCSFQRNWPDENKFEALVAAVCPLFIAAATCYRFISHEGSDPRARLDIVCGKSSLRFQQLDKTYTTVLKQMIEVGPNKFRLVVGTVVVLATPLSVSSITQLLNSVPESEIMVILSQLGSVLNIEGSNTQHGFVRVFHKSFPDFLLGPSIEDTEVKQYRIDERKMHNEIASRCIDLLSKDLKRNICKLAYPGAQRCDLTAEQIQQYIPPELEYACRYWIRHFVQSERTTSTCEMLIVFLQTHLLHWLELMSILGFMFETIHGIISLESTIREENNTSLMELVREAKRFVTENQLMIDKTPLQVYSSAILFLPEFSLLRDLYKPVGVQMYVELDAGLESLVETGDSIDETKMKTTFKSAKSGKKAANESKKNDKLARVVQRPFRAGWRNLFNGKSNKRSSPHNTLPAQAREGKISETSLPEELDKELYWSASLQTLEGHRLEVNAMVFSPDGNTLASGSWDGTIKLWDVATGRLQQTLSEHEFMVSTLIFSIDLDKPVIVSGSRDGTIKIWDLITGRLQQDIEFLFDDTINPNLVILSSDCSKLAFVDNNNDNDLWVVTTQLHNQAPSNSTTTIATERRFQGHREGILAVAFAPDGNTIATGSYDNNTIKLWDVNTGEIIHNLDSHVYVVDGVTALTFAPDGKTIATGSADGSVEVWDVNTGQCQQTIKGHNDYISAIAFTPNGNTLISGSQDITIRLWDVGTGRHKHTFKGHSEYIGHLAVSPDGSKIASNSFGVIKLWDATLATSGLQKKSKDHWYPTIAFSSDGNTIALSDTKHRCIRVWDIHTGKPQQNFIKIRQRCIPPGDVKSSFLAVSSKNNFVVQINRNASTVRLWGVLTGRWEQTFECAGKYIDRAALSPDENTIALISRHSYDSPDSIIELWDTVGQPQHTFTVAARPRCISICPGNKLIATGDINNIQLWDITGALLQLQMLDADSSIYAIAFSPTGNTLASSTHSKIQLWDVETGQRQHTFDLVGYRIGYLSFEVPDYITNGQESFYYGGDSTTVATLQATHDNVVPPINVHGAWIRQGEDNLLWLPDDQRPYTSTVHGTRVTIVTNFSSIVVLDFD